ncbi:MAG: FAD-binding oxidoreductase [Alphaproteobacteria bacterium]|nr:FAD-binding oxidoreductase [Alphaproteobacteria bacterium]
MTIEFRATHLPRQPGPAAWNALLPSRPETEKLNADIHVDIAVIGAGFAGLSAARRLAQLDPSSRIVVLEAGRLAEGPAGRNSGFMIDLPHDLSSSDYAGQGGNDDDAAQIALNRHAISFATEVAAESGLSSDAFDACGKVNGAATDAGHQHNLDYANHLDGLGEDSTLLDAQSMQDLTGTDYYRSGLFTPGTVMIQPAAYIRGLAQVLGKNVELYERSAVNAIRREGNGWVLSCGSARVRAQKIILATNGHAESFGFFKRRLMHVFTYASMTEPLGPALEDRLGGAKKWAITPADPMGSTLRRISTSQGDRIIVRSRFTCNPSMRVGSWQMKSAGHNHDRGFAERFPVLAGVKMQYRWAGQLCMSWNGVSAFGEIEDGLFAACCQNGLGVARGTLSGMAAAELAMGTASEAVDHLVCSPPPKQLPPTPLTWMGANLYMRWKEWASGREC